LLILKVTVTKSFTDSELFDENLKTLDYQEFCDVPSLNFYIQTFPKKYQEKKFLLVIYYREEGKIKLVMSTNENSLFVQ